MKLYEECPSYIEYGHKRYRLDLDFRKVLLVFDLYADPGILPEIQEEKTLDLLVKGFKKPPELMKQLLPLLNPLPSGEDNVKTIDFEQDMPLIYAAFWQTYGIDLERERLHWWKFLFLLQGLPSDTRMMQVVEIRTRPLPAPTRYNQKEIMELQKAKAKVALKLTEEERNAQYGKSLDSLFNMLREKAGEKNG